MSFAPPDLVIGCRRTFGAGLPERPGHFAAGIHVVECLLVFESVHARPEPVVAEGGQLLETEEPLKGLLDELLTLLEMVEDFAFEGENPAVDPEIGTADVTDVSDQRVVTERNRVKALTRTHTEETADLVLPAKVLEGVRQRAL